jgi:hypothetical protein
MKAGPPKQGGPAFVSCWRSTEAQSISGVASPKTYRTSFVRELLNVRWGFPLQLA